MKLKLLSLFAAIAFVFSACNKDEIADLEKRLDKVEDLIGSNEPISIKYSTKDGDNVDVIKNTSFSFKSSDYETSYAGDNGDGTYYIYIQRFSDVEWEDGAWLDFYYDSNTGEVIEEYSMGTYFQHENGQYQDAYFYYWASGNTRTVTVKSFDPETGKIDLSAVMSSTADYQYNEYGGKAMNLTLNFKGVLGVFDNTNNN